MRVFISWSGEPAKQIAAAMRTFVGFVFAGRVTPFMSEHDIEKGARFGSVLNEELESTDTGLLILTSQNQRAPWLVFEAGALSKSLAQSRVIPLVVDLEHADLNSPLGQFQDASISDRAAMWTVVDEVNRRLPECVPDLVLRSLFESSWEDLQQVVKIALDTLAEPEQAASTEGTLAEILELVRGVAGQQQRLSSRVADLERRKPTPPFPRRPVASGNLMHPETRDALEALGRQAQEPYAGFAASLVQSIRGGGAGDIAEAYEKTLRGQQTAEALLAQEAQEQADKGITRLDNAGRADPEVAGRAS